MIEHTDAGTTPYKASYLIPISTFLVQKRCILNSTFNWVMNQGYVINWEDHYKVLLIIFIKNIPPK